MNCDVSEIAGKVWPETLHAPRLWNSVPSRIFENREEELPLLTIGRPCTFSVFDLLGALPDELLTGHRDISSVSMIGQG